MQQFTLYLLLTFTLIQSNLFSQQSENQYTANKAISALKGNNKDLKVNNQTILALENIDENNFTNKKEYESFLAQLSQPARCDESKLTCATFHFIVGNKLKNNNQLFDAYDHYIKSEQFITQSSEKKTPFEAELYANLGYIYLYFNYQTKSLAYYFKALRIHPKNDELKINTINSIGLLYTNQKIDSALYYYNWALKLSQKEKLKIWEPIILGNLGNIFLLKKDTLTAINYFEKDKTECLKNKQLESSFYATIELTNIYLAQNKLDKVILNLNFCDSLLTILHYPKFNYNFHALKAKYFAKTNDYKQAYQSQLLVQQFKENSSNDKQIEAFKQREFQANLEKSKTEQKLLETQKQNTENLLIFLLIFFMLSISFLSFAFIQYRKRKRKNEELLNVRNLLIDENLKNNEKILKTTLDSLGEKNRLIDDLTLEIEKNVDLTSEHEKDKLIDKLQSFRLITNDDLIDYKRSFDKLHPGFTDYLTAQYPDITNAELRLATLIKLNYSNLEMSKTLGISSNSVRKTSLRLRKRINIETQEELITFIKNINN